MNTCQSNISTPIQTTDNKTMVNTGLSLSDFSTGCLAIKKFNVILIIITSITLFYLLVKK